MNQLKNMLKITSLCVVCFTVGFYLKSVVNPQTSSKVIDNIQAVKSEEYKGQSLITFSYDDGYKSVYDHALPLHLKYNIPATFNIMAKHVYLQDDFFMDAGMIKDSYDKGIEIASHTVTHRSLTELDEEEVKEELYESKLLLEAVVDEVSTIAIPYSNYNEEIKDVAKEVYDGVRVFSRDTNRKEDYDPYWLKSKAVTTETTFEEVKRWIDEAIEDKAWLIIMFHGVSEKKEEEYEITPKLLEEIMEYVKSKGDDALLPVNTKEGLELTKEWNQ